MQETDNPYQITNQQLAPPDSGPIGFLISHALKNAWQNLRAGFLMHYGAILVAILLLVALSVVSYLLIIGGLLLDGAIFKDFTNNILFATLLALLILSILLIFFFFSTGIQIGLLTYFTESAKYMRKLTPEGAPLTTIFAGILAYRRTLNFVFLNILYQIVLSIPTYALLFAYNAIQGESAISSILKPQEMNSLAMVLIYAPGYLLTIFLATRFNFLYNAAADNPDLGALESYKYSWRITRGLPTFFMLLLFLILLGLILIIIGLPLILLSCLLLLPAVLSFLGLAHADIYLQLQSRKSKGLASSDPQTGIISNHQSDP